VTRFVELLAALLYGLFVAALVILAFGVLVAWLGMVGAWPQ
jgi:hypothetical protein